VSEFWNKVDLCIFIVLTIGLVLRLQLLLGDPAPDELGTHFMHAKHQHEATQDWLAWGLGLLIFRDVESYAYSTAMGQVSMILYDMAVVALPVLIYMIIAAITTGILLDVGYPNWPTYTWDPTMTSSKINFHHPRFAGLWGALGDYTFVANLFERPHVREHFSFLPVVLWCEGFFATVFLVNVMIACVAIQPSLCTSHEHGHAVSAPPCAQEDDVLVREDPRAGRGVPLDAKGSVYPRVYPHSGSNPGSQVGVLSWSCDRALAWTDKDYSDVAPPPLNLLQPIVLLFYRCCDRIKRHRASRADDNLHENRGFAVNMRRESTMRLESLVRSAANLFDEDSTRKSLLRMENRVASMHDDMATVRRMGQRCEAIEAELHMVHTKLDELLPTRPPSDHPHRRRHTHHPPKPQVGSPADELRPPVDESRPPGNELRPPVDELLPPAKPIPYRVPYEALPEFEHSRRKKMARRPSMERRKAQPERRRSVEPAPAEGQSTLLHQLEAHATAFPATAHGEAATSHLDLTLAADEDEPRSPTSTLLHIKNTTTYSEFL
jgi:hypothetical protein